MWGAIIGGALNIGGQLFAGHQQRKLAKEQEKNLQGFENRALAERDRDVRYAQDLFNRDYYTNYTDTAEGRNMLNQMSDMYKRANSTSMLTGGTLSEEAKLARLSNQTQQMGDAAANMAAMGTQRKDMVQNRFDVARAGANNAYTNAMNNAYGQRQNMLSQRMDQWNNFANNAGGIGSALMGTSNLFASGDNKKSGSVWGQW